MTTMSYINMFLGLVMAAGFLIRHWQRSRALMAPPLGTNWPVVGMLPTLLRHAADFHDFLTAVLRRQGGTVESKGPWLTDMDSIITSDPANVRHILSGNFGNYPKGPVMKDIFEPFGDGIFAVDFEPWVLQRKKLQLLMKNNRYKSLLEKAIHAKLESGIFPVLNHSAENNLKLDLQDVFQRFTFDIICITVLGFDPCSLNIGFQDVSLAEAFDDIEKAMFRRHVVPTTAWKLQNRLGIGAEKRLTIATNRFDHFLYDFISKRRNQLSNDQSRRTEAPEFVDLLTAHIVEESQNDTALLIEDKFLRDMTLNLLGAGRSTIASTLVWFFWSLANNPNVENKILAELKSNPPASPQAHLYSEEEVNRLMYLHAAVLETLRLYPPSPINHKWAKEADTLPSGHRVRANTRVFFSVYSMARMEGTWGKDCEEFRPERWITEKGGIRLVPSHQFVTFNGGPRSCLGKEVSLIQLKMVAAAVLGRYKIQVVEGHSASFAVSTVLHMEHGLPVMISRRSA
ncbi:unnamed protein product [Linum tenue]|uniref:Cytochrome P450 n=1 Tax=Linum tenue TaxID=586396 RepID=A0AAV0JW65_9ROSI|nr:unnamed protein product [Linum tenue]